MPYVVRERRFDPRPYLPLPVGTAIIWGAVTDGDALLAVLGMIGGGGLVALGILRARAALRREVVLAVDRDGFLIGGAKPRRLQWADVTAVRTWTDIGGAETTRVQPVVQVELADGTVEQARPLFARYDSRRLESAVREAAPQVPILSQQEPEPSPPPPLGPFTPVYDWLNRSLVRRGRPPLRPPSNER
ncbi:hypothetical protein Psi02_11890 [Planotetraspora silvatica]|uniref:PH domain-containing protein n=1 Tax=Planotetraspora silvatica TaxID=234614 RepID=A0A8J3XL04_9ACTN|nr:hypothetical protein Psi02_11890 [Planotetraspora silvatica]